MIKEYIRLRKVGGVSSFYGKLTPEDVYEDDQKVEFEMFGETLTFYKTELVIQEGDVYVFWMTAEEVGLTN